MQLNLFDVPVAEVEEQPIAIPVVLVVEEAVEPLEVEAIAPIVVNENLLNFWEAKAAFYLSQMNVVMHSETLLPEVKSHEIERLHNFRQEALARIKLIMTGRMTTLTKIISGGQTGADQSGLDAAIALGIPTGGTAPKGWLIQDFDCNNISCPELATKYGLVECANPGYPARTRCNVVDADGTLWMGFEDSSGGKLTIGTAKRLGKPWIANPSPAELRQWIEEHKIRVLNVAGNRHSRFNPKIYEQTYDLLIEALAESDRP